MTAADLARLLRARHADDLYVGECKDGATQMRAHHVRLDGWAMKRSWAHPKLIGYEIKVNRQDFLRDDKWRQYLPMCNELWFVAPPGLIDPGELSDGVGLLVASANATMLYSKRKAVYREIEPPVDVFRYILMCRAKIGSEIAPGDVRAGNVEQWQHWLEEKEQHKRLGYEVRREIRERFERQEQVISGMAEAMKTFDAVRRRIVELGFDPEKPVSEWRVADRLRELRAGLPDAFARDLERAIDGMQTALRIVRGQPTPEGGDDAR